MRHALCAFYRMMETARQVFEGIKVAEFAAVAAGPVIGKHMADHGALVVHVESYERPDGFRLNYPPYKDNKYGLNRAGSFAICNNNKYGVTIDLKAKEGVDLALELIEWSDVVIENFTPGTIKKLGIGYEEMKRVNPRIILFSTCNQGQTGPHAFHPGFGSHLSSLCGFTYVTGYPDRLPCILGPYVDFVAVGYGVIAVTAALEHRRRTGEGQWIDLAQYEAGIQFMIPALLEYSTNHRVVERDGNRHRFAAPHNTYRCKGDDRWCAISVFKDEEWKALCECMGREELISDPRFKTIPARKKHEDEVDREVGKWTAQLTAEEVFKKLQENGVKAGIVQTLADLFADPQLKHRGSWAPVDHPEIGRCHAEGPPFALSKTPFKIDRPAPMIGEHNELVFKTFLTAGKKEKD
ncbi:MAG TPA: CoA transferase [Syntrophales bacterium]|nr:CoA transferase [Syntrophales bacterium]